MHNYAGLKNESLFANFETLSKFLQVLYPINQIEFAYAVVVQSGHECENQCFLNRSSIYMALKKKSSEHMYPKSAESGNQYR